MNCVEYESVAIEESTREKEGEAQTSKSLAVPSDQVHMSDEKPFDVADLLNIRLEMPT
jgi:hypothetical protein